MIAWLLKAPLDGQAAGLTRRGDPPNRAIAHSSAVPLLALSDLNRPLDQNVSRVLL